MKKGLIEAFVLALVAYLIISFIMASISPVVWGIYGRISYTVLTILLIGINKKLDV